MPSLTWLPALQWPSGRWPARLRWLLVRAWWLVLGWWLGYGLRPALRGGESAATDGPAIRPRRVAGSRPRPGWIAYPYPDAA